MRWLAATFFWRDRNALAKEQLDYLDSNPSVSVNDNVQGPVLSDFAAILESIGRLCGISADDGDHPISPNTSHLRQDVFHTLLSLPDGPPLDLKSIREHQYLRDFEAKYQLEIVLDLFHLSPTPSPPTSQIYRPFRLALFDMDSTLINEEVIDELARSIGVYDKVSAITSRAMNDPTFDFASSLEARVALLKGVPSNIWTSLRKQITIATGAKELITGLKSHGIITGVISGGFTPMAEWLKGELGLDLAFANHLSTSGPTLEYDYPHLTGEVDLSDGKVIVTPEYKKATLISEAKKRGVPLEQTLAAGDGSNDLKMLGAAGLGIAWNAKLKTQEMAPMRLNGKSLAELLFLLGPTEQEIERVENQRRHR